MRITGLLLALALPLAAQTVDVKIDTTTAEGMAAYEAVLAAAAARTDSLATLALAWVVAEGEADSLDFTALGAVTVAKDLLDGDGQYVQVTLPTGAAGLAGVLARQAMVEAVQDFKGIVVSATTVRMRKDLAVEFRRGLSAALQ